MTIKRTIKRDGRIVKFNAQKITDAIMKAMIAVGKEDEELAAKLTVDVVANIGDREEITVEEVQDLVEDVLIRLADPKLAKAYIRYRDRRAEIRDISTMLDIDTSLKFSASALVLLNSRYLRVFNGKKETPSQMYRRVAKAIAQSEQHYGENPAKWARAFYNILSDRIFQPNTPCLALAGTEVNNLAACYVLPIEDSMESIFGAVKDAALVMKGGGGVGFNFSTLRPANDIVKSTNGISSGPLTFMKVFDITADVIKQGSIRRGGCMGLLRVDHPDIFEFIRCKTVEGQLSNFNISVALTKEFFESYTSGVPFKLINPRTGEAVREVLAEDILDLIVQHAWLNGEPGVIFLDNINADNPMLETMGEIQSVNLCSELPLYPSESCILGSIDLAKFVDDGEIVWTSLRKVVKLGVRFLDDAIDASSYPLPHIEQQTKQLRRLGLGVMGFANMLYKLGIPYNSDEALEIADKVMGFINTEALKYSKKLGEERGSFPAHERSSLETPQRNVTVTSIPPTGSVSILAGTSTGIEPNFGIVFKRENVLDGKTLTEINPVFEEIGKLEGWLTDDVLNKVIDNNGRVTGISEIPEKWQRVFITALEIDPIYHLKMQAAFQKHVGSSISKTINMPYEATLSDIDKIITTAHAIGCKGLTVYRNASRQKQVMNVNSSKAEKCPLCETDLVRHEGCTSCPSCGYSKCDVI